MRRLAQLRRRIGLVAEVLWTYVIVRAAMTRWDLPTVVTWLRRHCDRAWGPTAEVPDRHLAEATVRVLRRLPTDTRCLMRSLVLLGVLSRRGIGSTLVVGVRPGTTFGAHAWVECGSRALLDPQAGEFSRLLTL